MTRRSSFDDRALDCGTSHILGQGVRENATERELRRGETREWTIGRAVPDGIECIGNDVLQARDILEKPLTANIGEPAKGLGAIVRRPLLDLHQFRLLQHLEMTAEIPIGQLAAMFEIVEYEPFRMGDQRGQNVSVSPARERADQGLHKQTGLPLSRILDGLNYPWRRSSFQ